MATTTFYRYISIKQLDHSAAFLPIQSQVLLEINKVKTVSSALMTVAQGPADSIFADLPEALVEEMLSHYKRLGEKMTQSLGELQGTKADLRNKLLESRLLKDESTIIRSLANPTTCASDGAYAIERLLSTDIVAIAGVAIEGLTPPSETRHWDQPRHRCFVFTLNHHESTFILVGALMLSMELELASKAPHDVVLLDGSMLTPLIRFNQAIAKLGEVPRALASIFSERIGGALHSYREILGSKRSDKIYASMPKYTSRTEIASKLAVNNYEDRALLSVVMNGGEIVGPVTLIQQHEHPNFVKPQGDMANIGQEILSLIDEISVIYYRPSEYMPALRIEVSSAVAKNQNRLSILLESLRLQCNAPGIMEPYPLYMADRMVKHLGNALPALRRATTQEMAMASDDVGAIFQAMHAYRTEHGRS